MRSRNGQTLVLTALTMLLVTLLALMTLGIGTKVKEKMELQTAADLAAYSNAVATARTFNLFSTLNRVGVAHMVSALSTQALISWSTYYTATINRVHDNYSMILDIWTATTVVYCALCASTYGSYGCDQCAGCGPSGIDDVNDILDTIEDEQDRLDDLSQYDKDAAQQVRDFVTAADTAYLAGQLPAYVALNAYMKHQVLAGAMIQPMMLGQSVDELEAPPGYDTVATREIGYNPTQSAIWGVPGESLLQPYDHHAMAVMGSRLHPFTTSRAGGLATGMLIAKLVDLIDVDDGFSVPTSQGSAYINASESPTHGSLSSFMPNSYLSADDHMLGGLPLTSYFLEELDGQCSYWIWARIGAGSVKSKVNSGRSESSHEWTGSDDDSTNHKGGGVLRMYPQFVDYNLGFVDDIGNNWGQPKNFAVIRRNYAARAGGPAAADPWNPFFRFQFSSSGATFDGRVNPSSEQLALATGITYYHRGGHFKEAPNFFNPFWRAGLTRLTIDNQGLDDVAKTFSGPSGEAFTALRNNGFKGWQ